MHCVPSEVGVVVAVLVEVKIWKLHTSLAPLEMTVNLFEVAAPLQLVAVSIAEPADVHLVTSCVCLAPAAAGFSQGSSSRLAAVSARTDELAGEVVQQTIVVSNPLKWDCHTQIVSVDLLLALLLLLDILQPFVSSSDMQSLRPSAFLIFAAVTGILAVLVAALAAVAGSFAKERQLARLAEAYGTPHGEE